MFLHLSVTLSGGGVLYKMSLSVWLPGPMFLPGGLCEVGVLCERGRRPPATEVGDTHPTGMHSCYV